MQKYEKQLKTASFSEKNVKKSVFLLAFRWKNGQKPIILNKKVSTVETVGVQICPSREERLPFEVLVELVGEFYLDVA